MSALGYAACPIGKAPAIDICIAKLWATDCKRLRAYGRHTGKMAEARAAQDLAHALKVFATSSLGMKLGGWVATAAAQNLVIGYNEAPISRRQYFRLAAVLHGRGIVRRRHGAIRWDGLHGANPNENGLQSAKLGTLKPALRGTTPAQMPEKGVKLPLRKALRPLVPPAPGREKAGCVAGGGPRPPESLRASAALVFPAPQAPPEPVRRVFHSAPAEAPEEAENPAEAKPAAPDRPNCLQEAVLEEIMASLELAPEVADAYRRARKGLAPQKVFRPDSGAWRLYGHRLEIACLTRLGITPQIFEAARKKIGVWDPRGRSARRRFLAYAASIARRGMTAQAFEETAELAGKTWRQVLAE